MSKLLVQFIRFASVGLGATTIHLVTAWIFHNVAQIGPLAANAIGFCTAFAASYLGHFHWTFERHTGHGTHLPRFLVVAGFGFACTHAITWAVTQVAEASFNIALLAIVLTVPLTTWTLSRLWAFRG